MNADQKTPVAWMMYGTTEDGSFGLVHFTQNPDDATALHIPLFLAALPPTPCDGGAA